MAEKARTVKASRWGRKGITDRGKIMRVGIGYDIHRLAEGRELVLGGVKIPFEKGLKGHSDADVLLHAVSDAILGALSEKDIGELFPDSDPAFKGADSRVLLGEVKDIMEGRGYRIMNLDCVVIAEQPRISPYRSEIQRSISGILGILPEDVALKGKTNEGIGAVGSGDAVAVHAVVLLERIKS